MGEQRVERDVIGIWDAERLGYRAAALPAFQRQHAIAQPASGIPFPSNRGFDRSLAPVPALICLEDATLLPDGSIVTNDHYIFHGLTFVPHLRPWHCFAPFVVEGDDSRAIIRVPEISEVDETGLYQCVTGHIDNFAHFQMDFLPRLFFREYLAGWLPSNYRYLCKRPAYSMQTAIYQALFPPERVLWQNRGAVRSKRSAVAALASHPDGTLKEAVEYAQDLLRQNLSRDQAHYDRGMRIYISRADGKTSYGRTIANESELTGLLEGYGFTSIILGASEPCETIRAFAKAECIVGLHGAGMMNFMFCEAPTKIIELYVPHTTPPWLARIGCLIDHKYTVYSLNRENDVTTVDIQEFESCLKKVLAA